MHGLYLQVAFGGEKPDSAGRTNKGDLRIVYMDLFGLFLVNDWKYTAALFLTEDFTIHSVSVN